MIEILLAGTVAEGRPVFPDSGPGNKTLAYGNEQAGFFGVVTQEEFMTMDEFRSQISLAWDISGVVINFSAITWYKCMHNSKVLFIASGPVATGKWLTIYEQGLIFGVDGPGTNDVRITPHNQLRIVETNREGTTKNLVVRTMTSGPNDSVQMVPGYEYSDLFPNLLGNNARWVKVGNNTTANWLFQEIKPSASSTVFSYSGASNTSFARKEVNINSNGTGFVPVLELVDYSDTLFPLEKVSFVSILEASTVSKSVDPEPEDLEDRSVFISAEFISGLSPIQID